MGADVTVIPETAYERERDGSLTTSIVPLSGPTGETLQGMRQILRKPNLERKRESTGHLRRRQPSQSTTRQASSERRRPGGANTTV